ncbi:F390 synthetase-related protein [Arenivirga flava]|uniref:Coenzyme F390 synthetase n=1 Tax=Arenivirga flava TaxID=1930060 RepID=A0AA37UMU5_9MICO|nr:F390 synthetase-related protein [Arenivirga flava]GMA27786.1 coenzyme F390 synthetase [Arenivirga flava]
MRAFVVARWLRRFRSRAQLERHQRRRVRRHLRLLRRRSPWFAAAPARLDELPRMDKAVMMANFDAMNTVGVTLDDAVALAADAERRRDFGGTLDGVSVGLSSGTSGHRGVFVVSAAERDAWAGTVLALTLPRGRILDHRIALFLRAGNELYDTVRSRAVEFRYFDVHGDLGERIRSLAAYEPTILVAPPSVLLAIAEAGLELRPQRVYAVAEVLERADARRLEAAFGQPFLHQLYQCTEGFLARTCDRGVLHLNEELLLFEREAVEGRRFVPIVTDFSRVAQPIVRYRLNDLLVERAEPCDCGSVLTALERIEGREDDALLLGGVRVFADLVARAMIHAEGFSQWRVVQTGAERVEVLLDDPAGEAGVRERLEALWRRQGAPAPELRFGAYAPDPTRKLRRVERAWKEDADASA